MILIGVASLQYLHSTSTSSSASLISLLLLAGLRKCGQKFMDLGAGWDYPPTWTEIRTRNLPVQQDEPE